MTDAILVTAFCIVAFVVASFGAVFAFVALGVLLALGIAVMIVGICGATAGRRVHGR